MPACVTHHQFGEDALCRFDAGLKSRVLAHRREFEVGLQGPDIFFFYRPYRENRVTEYGNARHREIASRMFSPILADKREGAAFSYMIGLICHYALDAICHPYIDMVSRDDLDHHRIEAAYDRNIMDACRTTKSRHLLAHVSGLDVGAIACFWPGIDDGTIVESLRWRRCLTFMVDRRSIVSLATVVAPSLRELASALALPDAVPNEQLQNVREIDKLYRRALVDVQEKIESALATMGSVDVRLAGFETNYGGEAANEQDGEKLDTL